MKLSDLANIGKNLEKRLISSGVESPEELKSIGSMEAILKLKNSGEDYCLNTLYALEGAIQGIRWHGLSSDRKEELKEFFKQINNI